MVTFSALSNSLKKSSPVSVLKKERKQDSAVWGVSSPPIFLNYQSKWVADQSSIKIGEKSRRVGLSWADAADSALEASRSNGCDTFYIGYNREMAKQYIEDCAYWAKNYNLVCSEIETEVYETSVEDPDKDIIAFRITFASGFIIQALSSKPRSIRSKGKPGSRLRIDELAFHDNAKELVEAAIAFKMWGGKIAIWSTHFGKKSYFNQLIQEVKAGEKPFSYHRVTIQDALDDGLYRRICLINGEVWTSEKEQQWLESLIAEYGIAANEELYCIPSDYNLLKIIDRNWFSTVSPGEIPYCDRLIRFWDFAATQKDLPTVKGSGGKKLDPCNTVGTLLGYSTYRDLWVVKDVKIKAFNPANTNQLLVDTAKEDGKYTPIAHEQEPGASGIRDAYTIKLLLADYSVTAVEPQGDKLLRARPFANDAKRGKILILEGDWNEDWLTELDDVPFGKMDCLDSASGAYNFLSDKNSLNEQMAYFR